MILLGYGLLILVLGAFFRYPKWGVLIALLLKPSIDMFWWVGSQGYISPLFIAGVAVPTMAILGIAKLQYKQVRVPIDNLIITYLLVFLVLTLLKFANSPEYIFNSVDSYSRVLSVTLMYFVGRFYFQSVKDRKLLVLAILGSVLIPFILTLGQGAIGYNLTNFADVYAAAAPGVSTNEISGYYMHGRHGLVRISGVYEGVYELAFMGVISAMIVIALRDAKDFRLRNWHYGLLIAGLYLLYFTYSRSAWITALASFVLYFMMRKEFVRLVVIVGLVLAAYVLVETIQNRFEDELGFLLGRSDFDQFGYSRGRKWIVLFEGFNRQDLIERLIGNYGLGNPENQFLGTLFWYGYAGLTFFILMSLYLSVKLILWIRLLAKDQAAEANVQVIMGCFIIASYWFAGNGNHFVTQISTQWVIWLWLGVIATSGSALTRERYVKRSYSQTMPGQVR